MSGDTFSDEATNYYTLTFQPVEEDPQGFG